MLMAKNYPTKSALITGVTGQDGAFLSQLLLKEGYKVYGTVRRGASPKTDRLRAMKILDKIIFIPLEVTEFSNVLQVLSDVQPDQIYNLSAQSFVQDSFRHPIITNQTNYVGVLNLLESIRILKLDAKFFQPSTSEMYGDQQTDKVNELSNFSPSNPYGLSKFAAYTAMKIYRESFGLRASSAILFNHESQFRGREFVTRKITYHLARLKVGDVPPLKLGNLSAARDWGYANDFMMAVRLIMSDDKCDDYVVSTNKLHTVRYFFELSAQQLGFSPRFEGKGLDEKCFCKKSGKLLCEVDEEFFRERDTKALMGDYSKITKALGWKPKTSFENLVSLMSNSDLNQISNNKWSNF